MKLKELIAGQPALKDLMKQNLTIGLSWDLKVFVKKVEPELLASEAARNEKVKVYGEPILNEDGTPTEQFKVKKEFLTQFYQELEVLQNIEIDVLIPEVKMM